MPLNLDEKNIVNNLSLDNINYLGNMSFFMRFNNIAILHGELSNKDNLNKLSKNAKSKILRVRHLDGNFVPYRSENNHCNGRRGFIAYGHQKFNEVKFNKHA